jgi:ribosome-binding ATPase YchF (GTP1/OBG family)
LGNQFLDDLRTADVLIHIVDASGTTDANGKEAKGYDPSKDIEWLRDEIHNWVFNNLWKRWPGIVRRHLATKSTNVETLHAQFSGMYAVYLMKTLPDTEYRLWYQSSHGSTFYGSTWSNRIT